MTDNDLRSRTVWIGLILLMLQSIVLGYTIGAAHTRAQVFGAIVDARR